MRSAFAALVHCLHLGIAQKCANEPRTMKDTILQLHAEMEDRIARLGGVTVGTAMSEEAYLVTTQYWQRVKQLVRDSGFADDASEIDFFKNLKSKFTSLLEYYLLVRRYQDYSDGIPEVIERLRQQETTRIIAFRQKHAAFIDYYNQGRTEWDDLYFLRRKYHKVQRVASQVYDRMQDFWTNGDWILTIYQADKLFEEFLSTSILTKHF